MFRKKLYWLTAILVVAAMILGACGGAAPEAPVVDEPEAPEVVVDDTEEEVAEEEIAQKPKYCVICSCLRYVKGLFPYRVFTG